MNSVCGGDKFLCVVQVLLMEIQSLMNVVFVMEWSDFECSNGLISCDYAGCCAGDGVYQHMVSLRMESYCLSCNHLIFDEITFQGGK